jgi:hypothetical protein
MHVHEQVLAAANRIARQRNDWTFTPDEVIRALPTLNQSSVRTDIVSRCCVNAPQNHLRKWDYFERVGRGTYKVRSKYRAAGMASAGGALHSQRSTRSGKACEPNNGMRREVIHAVVHRGHDAFTAQCLEIAAVTQGGTLDETLHNLNEVVALYFEGEDLAAMGFSERLRLQVIFETSLTL